MSRGGRRRMWRTGFRVTGAVVTVVALVGGIFYFTESFKKNPHKMSAAVEAAPVNAIVMRTDGVLSQDWLARTLALPRGVTLMELDIQKLRSQLESYQQIRSANVRRRFPSTLEVSLAERAPVARVMAQIGDTAPQALLVARDGTVFPGVGFSKEAQQALPYLDGIKMVRRDGQHYLPIKGMDIVSDLLATARNDAPQLYRDWQVVSLARLANEGEILVRSKTVEQIVFTTRTADDFLKQIAQLDILLDSIRAQTGQPVREINFAVGRMSDGRIQVPVTFSEEAPILPVAPRKRVSPSPQLNPSRKPNREL